MTCDRMLVAMLDAEPRELTGDGTSKLAVHVRSCARCGAVARTLTVDLHALGGAVAPKHAPNFGVFALARRAPRRLVIGAGMTSLAASILLAIGIQYGLTARITIDEPLPDAEFRAQLAARHRGSVAAARASAPVLRGWSVGSSSLNGYGSGADGPAYAAVAFAAPAPVEPVSIVATTIAADPVVAPQSDPLAVIVDPAPGTRVAIMKTKHPNVTVVWAY